MLSWRYKNALTIILGFSNLETRFETICPTSVVDQNVYLAVLSNGLFNDGLPVLRLGYVTLCERGVKCMRLDILGDAKYVPRLASISFQCAQAS
jgi:hypothetical protein